MYIIRVNSHAVTLAETRKEAILRYNDLFHAYKYIGEVKEDYTHYRFSLDDKHEIYITGPDGKVLEANGPE